MPLSKNIKTDYGATGDGQLVTAVLSITSGLKVLTSTTNLWVAGDVGKNITVDGAGPSSFPILTTIAAFTNAQSITLADAASTTLSSASVRVAWGTNDSPSFVSFNTDGRAASGLVTLTIPAGIYYLGATAINDEYWTRGIALLQVVGVGSPTLTGNVLFGGFTYPGQALTFPVSSRVASVNAGASSVQLLTPAEFPRFQPGNTYTLSNGIVYVAGTTAVMRCIDMQGFGDPNCFTHEYVTITNVNTGTGVITFSAPLTESFLSTYPLYNPGSAFTPDCGGPATLYMLDASWDCDQEYIGLQFWHPQAQINSAGRSIKFTNCTWIPNLLGVGPNPSMNDVITMDGCTFTGIFMEVDKTIGRFTVTGCVGHTIWFQSSCIEELMIDSTTMDSLQGTPAIAVLSGSTITSLQIGAEAYGRSDSVTASNCTFSSISALGVIEPTINASPFSISNGVISDTAGPARWAIPGSRIMFQGTATSETQFIISSLSGNGSPTVAATTTFIGTDIAGSAFPNVPLQGGTGLGVMAHPCPSLTMVNCIGCADAVDLSNVGARGRPIYSYSKRSYERTTLVNPIAGPNLWGRITSVKITVGVAFTTAGALTLRIFGQFAAGALNADNSQASWNLTVDLKTAGVRTVTATAVTGSAGTDSLSAPGAIWFTGSQSLFISGTITVGDPGTVEVETITNQGFDVVTGTTKRYTYVTAQI